MSFTGAAVRIGTTGGLGQGEARLQGVTGLDGELYAIGRTHNRIIHVTDISAATGVFASAALGAPHSIAGHNGSLYVFIGTTLKRFDPPFSNTDTGTDVLTLSSQTPRALTSDGTNLFYASQFGTSNLLYRIDDLDGTPTTAGLGTIQGNSNLRGLMWFDGLFYGVDPTTDALYVLDITDSGVTRSQVGSFSQFDATLANAQGLGIRNGVGYIVAIDNSGSLYRLRDFKFTQNLADQSWTVGEAVSVSAPATEEGASPITFAISPELPAGMTFNTATGEIDGTPTANSDATDYTITATDDNGIIARTTFQGTVGGGTPPPPPEDAVLEMTVSPNSVTAGGIATVTFTFNKSVNGFIDADVNVSAGATKGTLTDAGNNVWEMEVTAPSTGSGTVTVSVAADVVSPGNNADSVQFTYTAPPPPTDAVLDITVSPASVTAGGVATVTFTFDKAVSGFTGADVSVSTGATKGTLTDAGNNVWEMEVTAPSTGSGTVTVSVAADVVSPGNNADSVQFAYTAPPPPPIVTTPGVTTPGAPQNLRVELTPTTALLRWAAPVDSEITEYEVSAAVGASPGTTWIPTGSTRTRFLVKRLKRGTQYTFRVRGRNSEGAGTASHVVTQNTPIASLHNTLFFKECVNYFEDGGRVSEHGNPSNIIRAVADNDYKTFSTETDYNINIAVGGNPTRVDAVCVKGTGIEGHSAEPTGGSGSGYTNRMMPSTVKNWEGTAVSTTVFGLQHDLYLLDSHFTATNVRLRFTGPDVKITEILLLEFGMEIDANGDFTQIDPDSVDRSGRIDEGPGGRLRYSAPLGGERDKWEVDCTVRVVPGKTLLETPEEFLYWRADNRNHVFCMEPSRFPWRIFPAVFVGKSVPIRYRTDSKTSGEILSFRVAEQ